MECFCIFVGLLCDIAADAAKAPAALRDIHCPMEFYRSQYQFVWNRIYSTVKTIMIIVLKYLNIVAT